MQIAVNWQDADSSSAKGVKEIFKYYFIFIIHNGMWWSCREGTQTLGTVMRVSGIERGFTGDECVMFMKVHIAEKYENETFTKEHIKKYESTFPNMFKDGCKCKGDRAGCGCLSDALYKKHTHISLPL